MVQVFLLRWQNQSIMAFCKAFNTLERKDYSLNCQNASQAVSQALNFSQSLKEAS